MAIVQDWLPPSRENWELIHYTFQFFPLVTITQWAISWYGMGKTSVKSRLNFPGKFGWLTMEAPGFLTLLYIMFTLPAQIGLKDLPWENKVMAGLFTVHYIYRAIVFPIIAPSMSPIHLLVWSMGLGFQLFNAVSIGGWLGGYGPTTKADWSPREGNRYVSGARMEAGLMIWAIGFILNIFHDDELREVRRSAARREKRRAAEQDKSTGKGKAGDGKTGVDKVYVIPKNGFFKWILYPHYLFEWMEWSGYWLMGGPTFVPGRTFLLNEISTMVPRALQGKKWYYEMFGEEKLEGRKAIIPGVL